MIGPHHAIIRSLTSIGHGAAAWTTRRRETRPIAFGVFWFGSSLEAYTYFAAQASALPPANENIETARHLIWAGRLSPVLTSSYIDKGATWL